MLPVFLVEETTVRESGQSAVFDATEYSGQSLLLTFGITHAVEQESIGIDIHGSRDGLVWSRKPLVSFTPKSYCGTYELTLPRGEMQYLETQYLETQYLKVTWSVKRWSRGKDQPFFRFYLFARVARARMAAAGAA